MLPSWLQSFESSALLNVLSAVAGGLVVAFFARYRARRQWERRHMLHLLNVSITMFADGFLKIRTILEQPVERIITNAHARDLLISASRRTADDDPIIVLPDEYHSFIMNYLLNATAERFSSGVVRADAGHHVATATYAMFLTAEPATRHRHRKIRVMLLKRELVDAFPYETAMPKLEHPNHADRVKTLRVAVARFRQQPDLFPLIELSV